MMDHEYEAVFKIGRLRSPLFTSGGGGGGAISNSKNGAGFWIEECRICLPHL